ncbi:helix-turn-helix domain-containing protein [uncultured Ruminococcus sp.]|uniref:AlbA family DNA-binding domain-containing protein n=1 Tax=uncultured Ruminococcus sp. TaxID=165186 RepID=UPI0026095EAF|nr:ATP-binding protein [uncultured Ruminococcus sp.]
MIDLANIERYKENNRIEAKKATGGLPVSLWETYSAFANTLGGVILLGVEEHEDKSLHPVDLPDPQWLLSDFYDVLNDRRRVSRNILSDKDVRIVETEGKRIIVINVPRIKKGEEPIYLGGSIYTGTYKRSGDGDYKCSVEEVARMLRRI